MRRKRVPSFLYIFSCILQRSLGKVCCLKQRSASHRSLIMPSFGLTSSSVGMALFLPLPHPPSPPSLSLPHLLPLLLLYSLSLRSSFISVHSAPPFPPSLPVRSCYVAFLEPASKLSGGKKEGCWLSGGGVGSLLSLIPVPLICFHPARSHCTPLRVEEEGPRYTGIS